MLLFERFYQDGRSPRRFYACSAARDRKDCSFFQWEGEKVSEARHNAHKEIVEASREPYREACTTYKNIIDSLDHLQRCLFCHSCSLLFLPKDKEKHQIHDYQQAGDVSKPTLILRPRENEKTQAVSTVIWAWVLQVKYRCISLMMYFSFLFSCSNTSFQRRPPSF